MGNDVLRVFLAEDNSGDVYLVGEAFKQAGLVPYDLQVATDGEEALDIVRRFGADLPRPDVALVDFNLPRHDGSELLKQLRERPECRQIPIIILTSSDAPADHQLAAAYGAVFFHKPLDMNEFFAIGNTVKELCGPRATQNAGAAE